MTSWICMKFLEIIFRDTHFENFHLIGSDKVVISWFRMFEILWISRVMPKSNHLWWRHFRSIMMSSEVKLVWHPRFWVELSFAIKFLNFDHPEFLWTSVSEGYFSIFKVEKINQKLLKFITQRVFLAKPTTLNPMSISVLFTSDSWKILNFNYVTHHCINNLITVRMGHLPSD